MNKSHFNRVRVGRMGILAAAVASVALLPAMAHADFGQDKSNTLNTADTMNNASTAPQAQTPADNYFDLLASFARDNPGDTIVFVIRAESEKTANQRNMVKMIEAIQHLSAIPRESDAARANRAAVLRDALLDEATAIVNHQRRGEFRLSFSRSKADTSAASSFYSKVRQAIDYHQNTQNNA